MGKMPKSKGTVISLGAGENQVPFIKKAVEMGFQVIGVDIRSNAPGFSYCRNKIIESVTEYRRIYSQITKLSLDEQLVGVGCRSYGKAVLTSAYLSEKFKLPGNPLSVLKSFYDKEKMKSYLFQNGINVPKQYNPNDILAERKLKSITFPIIYKPVDGNSKKGIKIISSVDDLKNIPKSKSKVFLEDFIDGPEFTVLGLVSKSKFHLVSVSDKITTKFPPYLEIAHVLPSMYSNYLGEINLNMQRIINITGLMMGPVVAEFKANSKGELFLMEIMPEIGGEYLAEQLIPRYYKYDYFLDYINIITSNNIKFNRKNRKSNLLSVMHFIVPPQGKYIYKKTKYSIEKSNIIPFFYKELLPEGTICETDDGNKERVLVIGYDIKKANLLEILPDKIGNLEVVFEKHN